MKGALVPTCAPKWVQPGLDIKDVVLRKGPPFHGSQNYREKKGEKEKDDDHD